MLYGVTLYQQASGPLLSDSSKPILEGARSGRLVPQMKASLRLYGGANYSHAPGGCTAGGGAFR